jgi:hypothetical protein
VQGESKDDDPKELERRLEQASRIASMMLPLPENAAGFVTRTMTGADRSPLAEPVGWETLFFRFRFFIAIVTTLSGVLEVMDQSTQLP